MEEDNEFDNDDEENDDEEEIDEDEEDNIEEDSNDEYKSKETELEIYLRDVMNSKHRAKTAPLNP